MRTTRDGSFATIANKTYKVMVVVVAVIISNASSMPQRSNVFFPSTVRQNADRVPNPHNSGNNGLVPILNPNNPLPNTDNDNAPVANNNDNSNNNNNNSNSFLGVEPTEFQVGTTGIACDRPGNFVMAPDGCNRCFCAENSQLSSACSRALCPPGFPSTSQQRRFNL